MASSLSAQGRKHHALAIPLPAQGHINPLMRICKRLASQEGFTITFVNIEPYHHRIAEIKQQLQEGEEADQERQLDIRRAHIPFHGMPELGHHLNVSVQRFVEALQSQLPAHIEHLVCKLLLQDPPITCLISDIYMTGLTQRVADKFNIPRIALYPSSQSVLLFSNYILEGAVSLEEVIEAVTRSDRVREDTFKEGLPGLPTLKNGDLMDYIDENVFMHKFNLQVLRESKEAHAIIVNSYEEIEGVSLKAHIGVPIYAIGPLVEPLEKDSSTSLWKEDTSCMLWLDEQPHQSVILVSFGSIATLSQSRFEQILSGLLSSQQRFLWVFPPNLVKDSSYSTFPIDMLSKSHGKGYSTNWAPQLSVLSHPSVGGFLTHCGWNSVLEAISQGQPMLCFPCFGDQFMNAKYVVEEWNIGLRLTTCKESDLVDQDEVENVIRTLMEGEKGKILRKNSKYMKEASNKSLLPQGNVFKNIQALVHYLN